MMNEIEKLKQENQQLKAEKGQLETILANLYKDGYIHEGHGEGAKKYSPDEVIR